MDWQDRVNRRMRAIGKELGIKFPPIVAGAEYCARVHREIAPPKSKASRRRRSAARGRELAVGQGSLRI
jgi:hypothetical protein